VIFAAGAVMVAVFFTFALSGPLPPKEMGVILGVAVLLDAALVRLLLVPVLLRLMGKWAWYLPWWAHRLLPLRPNAAAVCPAMAARVPRSGSRRPPLRRWLSTLSLAAGQRRRARPIACDATTGTGLTHIRRSCSSSKPAAAIAPGVSRAV